MASDSKNQFRLSSINKILPRSLRFSMFRRQLVLPSIENSGLIFKPAETKEEFESAFRVLHDSYVEFEYMKPHQSGFRVTPYHLLSSTVTLIVKKNEEVIATVSIVRDNPIGLPMDKIFDLARIRQASSGIAEISSLAIRKEHRGKKGAVLHLIMRYIWKFTQEYLNVETFVCAVNPAMNELWESVYLFKSIGTLNRVNDYDFVNGAPAVGLVVPVSGSFPIWESHYNSRRINGDLFNFIKQPFTNNEYHFLNPYYSVFRNSMKRETRLQFLTDPLISPLENLSLEEQVKAFALLGANKMKEFEAIKNSFLLKRKSERYETFCRLTQEKSPLILDVSETGLKIAPASWNEGRIPDFLAIQVGPNIISRVRTRLQWQSNSGATGHQVIDADKNWEDFIAHLQNDSVRDDEKKCS